MKRLKNGELDRDVLHALKLIKSYDKLLRQALKMGFCYNDDVCSVLHNERAFWINKLEQDSNDELIVKWWKDGSYHVYDRESYLAHTQGKKAARNFRQGQIYQELKRQREERRTEQCIGR